MSDPIVSFGVQKLWDLLSQEIKLFTGVEDQVTQLKKKLDLLKSFLIDADAQKHTKAVVRKCVEEIQEIVCDAEDILETFFLKGEVREKSGIKNRIKRIACIVPERREVALHMENIGKRISTVIRDMEDFGVQRIIADGSYMQPQHDKKKEMQQEFARDNESNFVGLEANVKKLVGQLVEEDNVQVVSITGMGGVGKTTLARHVFNHHDVKHQFERFAWACVSKEFTRISVWQAILRKLRPGEEERKILEMTESTLQDELYGLLETFKSLIVLDDIWKEEDWDLIKHIFPPIKGCKVLLTSRNESVARRGDGTYINFNPECLSIQDSWTLLQRIAFPLKEDASKEMEEMGKKMLKYCGGLPLAIKVLGGLLATKYTLHNWKRVSEDIGSHIFARPSFNEENNKSFYYILSLSFEELPVYLKHCFLYLSFFPEDFKINVAKLSYYWAAERIPKPAYYEGAPIQDVADGYIDELVKRNMVIAERDIATLRYETCHMHDMMREVCLLKAKEENFLQIAGTSSSTAHSQSSRTTRRLVLQYPTTLHVERDINNPKLRSLFIVLDKFRASWRLSGSGFTRLQLLRVLDLSSAKFKGGKLPSSIGKLIHLRYLSLERAEVSHLPSSLQNLKLLIYLNIEVFWNGKIYMPNFLLGMRELRYLALPRNVFNTKLEMNHLVNLETLRNFSTKNCCFRDLQGMSRLRTLFIYSDVRDRTIIDALSSTVGGLRHLENLEIFDIKVNTGEDDRVGFVLDCIQVKQLKLTLYMPRLPDEQHFPSNLRSITLMHCFFEEDPMPILGKLLHLNEVALEYHSFSGIRMVCSSGGFPQMRELKLIGLEELEDWIVEEGSMPLLHTLSISQCLKLKELPEGVKYITSLKDLSCTLMKTGWTERLSKGGKEYYKVQHIPYVMVSRDIEDDEDMLYCY